MSDFFTDDIVRLVLLVIFAAFLVFYLLYSFFAVYHALRYGFVEDKLTYPILIIFLGGSGALILMTLFLLGIL